MSRRKGGGVSAGLESVCRTCGATVHYQAGVTHVCPPKVDPYASWVERKLGRTESAGLASDPPLGAHLFPFQRDVVRWALRRGKAAIFADTGLGKTRMELEWAQAVANATNGRVLILTPLAVAAQTITEAARCGISANICRDASDVVDGSIAVANYERLHRFDPTVFEGVVLDESSCIKHHDTSAFAVLCEAFGRTPYRLAATATPAPNDHTELGTHAQFLGVCSQVEMLSEYFAHDGGDTSQWRIKGHARTAFWRWVATWGALIRRPSDLGYDDDGYVLPPLSVEHHVIGSSVQEAHAQGLLFAMHAQTLSERRAARKSSTHARAAACAALVNADSEPWIVWCDLNAEADALKAAIGGAVEVRGSDDIDSKERALAGFAAGAYRVLITKPSIAGFGLNWQHCARVAFVGVTDSWEAYYQAVRRCYRFGQLRPVDVHIFASEAEGSVIANLKRKEQDARTMADELSQETNAAVRAQVHGLIRESNTYRPPTVRVPAWMRSE